MSWDSYIDNLVAQSKDSSQQTHVDRACIIGLDGGGPWTSAGHGCGLQLKDREGCNIAKCFKSNDFTTFQSSGVHLEGIKYQFLRNQDGMILAKKKDNGAITMYASQQAIVIAHTKEGSQQGYANNAVNFIVEYLKSVGM